MKSFVFIAFILNISLAFSKEDSRKALEELWGKRAESKLESALFYLPRFIKYSIDDVITSRTSHRLVKTVSGVAKIPMDPLEGGYELADSALNPLGVLHDVGSDIVGLGKNVHNAAFPRSRRIELCSSNLMSNVFKNPDELTPLHFINPTAHIGVVIDEVLYETTDRRASKNELRGQKERGGIVCREITKLSKEPDNIGIERLMCVDTYFNPHYDLFKYNCGGYSKDILSMSGLGFPDGINWGVGSDFAVIDNEEKHKKRMNTAIKLCDEHIKSLRSFIFKLERGEDVSDELQYFRSTYNRKVSLGLYFQILILQSRNKDLDLSIFLNDRPFELEELLLDRYGDIRIKYRSLFQNLVKTIGKEGLDMIDEGLHGEAKSILKAAMLGKYERYSTEKDYNKVHNF